MSGKISFQVGDRVSFKAAGKVARLEGMSGKRVMATVTSTEIHDGMISVMSDYRNKPAAMFPGMGSLVPIEKLRIAKCG